MREATGELWDYYRRPLHTICITTNGTIKKNGEAVMGRGCAKEAKDRIPGIARELADCITKDGNLVSCLEWNDDNLPLVLSFPVKHNWWEKADLELIKKRAEGLGEWSRNLPNHTFVLPRPGCGNGQRTWEEIKPLLEGLPNNVIVICKAGGK